jgi:hypothetical protein
VSAGDSWYEWNITNLVQSWLKGERANNGLLLIGAGQSSALAGFSSREGSFAPEIRLRYQPPTPTPTPTLTYTPSPTPTPGPTFTPSPTLAPTPTLLPAGHGFGAQYDTYISQWYPTANYDVSNLVIVRQGDIVASLLKFDLRSLPTDTVVHAATLNLYAYHRTNRGTLYAKAYKVRRDWTSNQATWDRASNAMAWSRAGCNGLGTDRDEAPESTVLLDAENAWFSLDVTSMVREWVANPATNRGVALKGEGGTSVQYEFSSCEWEDVTLRPQLVVSYGELPPTATPTETSTPGPSTTPTPSLTASLTRTAGPSPTFTLTPTPSVTLTPSRTPTMRPSSTSTPTEYVAATPTPPAGATRYYPVADTTLNQWSPVQNLGTSPLLIVRQGDIHAALMRFDLSSISTGSYVQQAVLNFYVAHRTNMGALTALVYVVRRPWSESQATWNVARTGEGWAAAGCNGSQDRDLAAVATLTLDAEVRWYSLDLTPLVQKWVREPAGNYGLVIKGSGGVSVEYDLGAMEAANPYRRPHLYVQSALRSPTPTARPTSTAMPTPTRTPTRAATPTATFGPSPTTTPTFRPTPTALPGARVFPISRDTYVNRWSIDENYATASTMNVRQGDVMSPLLYTLLTSIPTGQQVQLARLHVFVVHRTNAGNLMATVHEVLRDWNEGEANWVRASKDTEWQESGCNDVGIDRAGEVTDQVQLNAEGAWFAFDVTRLVQHWVTDPTSNHGLILKGSGGTSVQYEFASRDFPVGAVRPWLEVLYGRSSPTPSKSPTHTMTSKPPSSSTPSRTATARYTPSPAATRTPSPAPTGTRTPTLPPGYAEIRVGNDTTLNAWSSTTNLGGEHTLSVRQGNIKSALLRFDLASVPSGATVINARLWLYVANRSNWHDLTLQAYAVRRAWTEAGATWNATGAGQAWAVPGCDGIGSDRDGTAVGSVPLPAPGNWVELNITSLVRSWVNAPGTNYGLLLKGEGGASVEYALAGLDHIDAALRPMLLVNYSMFQATPTPSASSTPRPSATSTGRPSASPTSRPSASPTPGSEPTVVAIPVDADADLDSWGPDRNNGYAAFLPLRTLGYKRPILHFPLGTLPSGARVQRAILRAQTSGTARGSVTVDVVGLLREWREYEVTWNDALSGQPWSGAGASLAGVDSLTGTVASTVVSGGDGWWEWDVTSLVRDWLGGRVANNGLMLVSNDSSQHLEMAFTSREHTQPAQLVVEYYLGPRRLDYGIQLYRGLNMVSLPVLPDDPSVEGVLGGIADKVVRVWAYDTADAGDPWKLYQPGVGVGNDLMRFTPELGYWIEISADARLTVSGLEQVGRTISLRAGWNFIGYPSLARQDMEMALEAIASNVLQVWHYDAEEPSHPWKRYTPNQPAWANDLIRLAPGKGYWVRVSQDCTLSIP